MITTSIGILAGIVMNYINADGAMLSIRKGFTQLFLIVLLPPILFESAINMETVSSHYNIISNLFSNISEQSIYMLFLELLFP